MIPALRAVVPVWFAVAVLSTVGCASSPPPEPPAPLHVLSSNGVKSAVEQVRPALERAIGRSVTFDFSTAVALKGKIDAGERFDVAILTPALIEALSASGAIGGTPVAFARTGVGVGIKTGAAVPDIRTPEALKATLLAASSVAFTAEGQSRATVDKAYAALGIADAMRAKSMLTGPGGGPVAVAEGKAELVLTLVSEILPVPGVRLVGPLPDALQGYVSFSAARSAMSREAAAADALLRFLSGPETAAALRSQGMTPAQP